MNVFAKIALALSLVITTTPLSSQILPNFTDVDQRNISEGTKSIDSRSRSFSQSSQRWKSLYVTSLLAFNKDGNLTKEGVFSSHIGVIQESSPHKSIRHLEVLYAYDENGSLAGKIDRKSGDDNTHNYKYYYGAEDRLREIVCFDSLTGAILSVEEFTYDDKGRPFTSRLRQFGGDVPLRILSDSNSIAQENIYTTLSEYTYDRPQTPIIFWQWSMGSDTIADKQVIKRYLDDGILAATITHIFDENGEVTSSQTQLFNDRGHTISTHMQLGESSYERAYDYIYELDEKGNWVVMKQYIINDPEKVDTGEEEKILIARTDRDITYYDE